MMKKISIIKILDVILVFIITLDTTRWVLLNLYPLKYSII